MRPRGRSGLGGMGRAGEEPGLAGWWLPAGEQRTMARVGKGLCLRGSGVWGAEKCWKQRGDVVLLADYQVL